MKVNVRQTGTQTDGGGGGVNGCVSSVQVSLLRVLCPNTLLSPYLLPLSSSADTACLDCHLPPPSFLSSLLSLSPQLQLNCVPRELKRLICQICSPCVYYKVWPTLYMQTGMDNIQYTYTVCVYKIYSIQVCQYFTVC